MIRVVNLDMMGDFLDGMRESRSPLSYMFVLLVVSGCTDGYDDLEERVRCVFMGDVTWNRVGCVDSKNTIYRWIQSPRSISFASLNGQYSMADFKKNKGMLPFSRTKSAHYGDLLSLSVGLSSQGCPISYSPLALILSK